jgi:hypothetical protein
MFYILVAVKAPALVLGVYFWKKLAPVYKLVFLQVVLALATEYGGHYISRNLHQYNIWLFNIYLVVVELWLAGGIAYLLLRQMDARKIFFPLVLLTTAIWQYGVYSKGINVHYTPFMLAISICVVFSFAVVLYYAFMTGGKMRFKPELWLCLSYIIFFGGIMPFYGFFNYMRSNHPEVLGGLFHQIVWTLNFIRYPMVAVAIYMAGKNNRKEKTVSGKFI